MSKEERGDSVEQRPGEGIPLCHGCFSPVDPSADYCSKCGSAVGQYTQYVPFVNIPWAASGYDRLAQLVWPANGSVGRKLIGIFAAMLLAPLLLLLLPFKWLAERRKVRQP